MRYKIVTYGCQMNVHDSEKIAGMLSELGYINCKSGEDADVIVFNTCCIRESAERKAIGNIGSLKNLKKQNPDVIIAVCGCMTQAGENAQNLKKKFPFIDIILGTHNLHCLKDYILKRKQTGKKLIEIWPQASKSFDNAAILRNQNISAFVNIIYGCDNYCSYCIVPYVRGRERSRPVNEIIAEVKTLVDSGYKEIMLLGQNVNSYVDQEGVKFYQLLQKIAQIEGKFRIRFMTSHPKDFDDNLIGVIKDNPAICNQIHLPLQSGSDRILKLMNRKYSSSDYFRIIEKIYGEISHCGITSDIMVGFPDESQQDFEDTLRAVERARYNGCYMFIYSPRSGTSAAKMENQISLDVKKQRIIELNRLQNSITREINKERYLNNTFEILVDGKIEKKQNIYCGKTECGRLISFKGDQSCLGQFLNITITKSATSSLFGEIQ